MHRTAANLVEMKELPMVERLAAELDASLVVLME